ncbi:MAG: Na+/H+ antiporter subunit E [Planctomycetota bacterium]|nr:Na+/H+ antiporter subunit E [Planctomycetota bacterium]
MWAVGRYVLAALREVEARGRSKHAVGFIVAWILLAALWIGLSGFFDAVHLAFGAISVTLVAAISHRHLTGDGSVAVGLPRLLRLALYVPWLLWQIAIANVDVLLRIIGFRDVDPCVVRFTPDLTSEFGVATLANSITLTPGTVTVDVTPEGEFIIHAISREAADAVLTRVMELKARSVEGSAPDA